VSAVRVVRDEIVDLGWRLVNPLDGGRGAAATSPRRTASVTTRGSMTRGARKMRTGCARDSGSSSRSEHSNAPEPPTAGGVAVSGPRHPLLHGDARGAEQCARRPLSPLILGIPRGGSPRCAMAAAPELSVLAK
jgi:hypothetical protein